MINLAIGLLWLVIGIIVLGGVIMILLAAMRRFAPSVVTENFVWGVWAIFGILILIYILYALEGGGGLPHPAIFRS